MANLIDTLGRQPFVDLFLYLDLGASKYRHLHRCNDSGTRCVSQPELRQRETALGATGPL